MGTTMIDLLFVGSWIVKKLERNWFEKTGSLLSSMIPAVKNFCTAKFFSYWSNLLIG
ncbi:hypothetical protein RO3G_16685 [Rhizopus delemar RA 99-880]|uniref:Uncharacterized protein n=1 Tax=Rhizopus delemar (strain RA 99-880 / ATCC MYA-4621 / FGSC 9543 / NRRL 43880) TaxID=246409 RepID=I1CU44_RHIO9|nr:hypothetical protein RO3G_16685 [Rhizopus delemar RA 99-880]|eukprot:EIE91974.1 hypothetical protein RO3G_16685 [Rhizopus delemar RA 99-880]